jgi:hypothetical protein
LDSNAETLGRLFFTPAERAALDRAGQGIVEKPVEVTGHVASSKISGYVSRSDGQVTVWMDNEPRFGEKGRFKVDPSAVQTSRSITIHHSPQHPK